MSGIQSEAELVAEELRFMDPANDQFLELLLRHQTEVKAFIGSVIRNRQARDDVFQEVAIILWKRFSEYDPNRPFGAWARGIAVNKILQELRQQKRFPDVLEPSAMEAICRAFDREELDSDGRRDALAECIESLPARSRQLLAMRYEEGWSCEDISKSLSLSCDAVYQALSRVRSKLAMCVDWRLKSQEVRPLHGGGS